MQRSQAVEGGDPGPGWSFETDRTEAVFFFFSVSPMGSGPLYALLLLWSHLEVFTPSNEAKKVA